MGIVILSLPLLPWYLSVSKTYLYIYLYCYHS